VGGGGRGNTDKEGRLTISINPILHTAWSESHALTLKNNTSKYYFGGKSSFLHTFLKFYPEFRTIQVNFKNILLSSVLKKVNLNVWQTSHHLF
jgi:hypothetical protein